MKMSKLSRIFIVIGLFILPKAQAGEGMWIPMLIEEMNITDMQAKGFKLSTEDIYSVNQACLKDAVVIFGRGCTGAIVSEEGLLLTNHHCGKRSIQSLSSMEHNYLKDGFWAGNKSEEINDPDLTVRFLRRMEDYTTQVLNDIDPSLSFTEKQEAIWSRIDSLESTLADSLDLEVLIEEFSYGHSYYMFLYERYTDIRLVGTPPSTIGEFGGDTDNWIWPRHNADFSVFRVYADKDGKPAEYSEDNIPYQPKKVMEVSAKGVNEGDFTMVLGFPGSTWQYLHSSQLRSLVESDLPERIRVRTEKLKIMDSYMSNDEKIKLQYASKQARVANAWKKWKGVLYGFNRFNVLEQKESYENDLLNRTTSSEDSLALVNLFQAMKQMVEELSGFQMLDNYFYETIFSIESMRLYNRTSSGFNNGKTMDQFLVSGENHFKNYNQELDTKITAFLLLDYLNKIETEYIPSAFKSPDKRTPEAIDKVLDNIYKKSVFTDQNRYVKFVQASEEKRRKIASKDPVSVLYHEFVDVYLNQILTGFDRYENTQDSLYHLYLPFIQKIDVDRKIYPDANFTMRMTYGQVQGYSPGDAVTYSYNTTLKGVYQKSLEEDVKDYRAPERLIELYETQDFGKYNIEGDVPVCFIATNHTSGGNSGSPVMNADGHLVGLNFDRTWEGTMGDYNFDDEICRNITVDIRYILFVIDKFAESSYLLDEMKIHW